MNISALDGAIIAAFLIGVVGIAVASSRRVRGPSDFFLAGRSMRWPFVGASLFATNISAEQFVGQAGLAFVVGLAVANYQLAGVLAFVAMGAVFLPIYMRLGLYTTPEFLERRYGPESRRFFSLITLVTIAFAGIPGSLYAGGRVMEVLFGFESIVPGVLILALAVGPYAMAGGLRTVILTDFVQCLLLVVGGAAMLYVGLDYLGGWGAFAARMQALQGTGDWDMLSLVQPLDHPNVPWTGVVLGDCGHSAVPLPLRVSGQICLVPTRGGCGLLLVGHPVAAAHAQSGLCHPHHRVALRRLVVAGPRLGDRPSARLRRRGPRIGLFGYALPTRGLRRFRGVECVAFWL